MADQKTFVLGLGAQKGGTSWLYRYLAQAPGAAFTTLKEYHVWDGATVPALSYFDLRSDGLLTRLRSGDRERLRRRLQKDPDAYFDHFAHRLSQTGGSLIGDLTPSHSALSAQTMAQIRDGIVARGMQVKAVFIAREPVERCWSAVRMYLRNRRDEKALLQGVDVNLPEEQALLDYIKTEQARLRTDYAATLSRARSVFAPQDLFVTTYETLFAPAEIERLSAFFGVPPVHEFVEEKVNITTKQSTLSPDVRRAVAAQFADVYDYIRANDPDIWSCWKPLQV